MARQPGTLGDSQQAAEWFEKALAVLRPLQQAGKLARTQFARAPGHMETEIRSCREGQRSLESLETLLKKPEKEATALLAVRAEWLVRQGKHADAVAAAGKLVEMAKSGEQFFLAANAYAWCSRDKPQQDRHAARAVELLGKARDAGFFKEPKNVAALKQSEAFKPLLARDDFKKLLAELEKK